MATIPSKKLPKGWKVGRGEVGVTYEANESIDTASGGAFQDPHQRRLQRESPFEGAHREKNWQKSVGSRHVPPWSSLKISSTLKDVKFTDG